MYRIAINGFGRIGRNILRALYESNYRYNLSVVAINEIFETKMMAHLLKYDSTHGIFPLDIRYKDDILFIDQDSIRLFHQSDINKILWNNLNIDIILDCTGFYGSKKDGNIYLSNGIKRVLFSNLGKDDIDKIIIYGVNETSLKNTDKIVSNGSCTTNCVIPVIKVLNDFLKVKSGLITVIHSAMNDQCVIDSYCNNFRLTRSALHSIVPIETKLSEGISRIFPKFKNRFKSISLRVPVINVTAIDLNVLVHSKVNVIDVNKILQYASKNIFFNIFQYSENPLVSVDFNHNSHSVIIDGTQTCVSDGSLIKILAWCDNEWGFANRMLDTAFYMVSLDKK